MHDDTFRPPQAGAGMREEITRLVAEAERLLRGGLWDPAQGNAALARETATGLAEAVREESVQGRLPFPERLERLRETLAVIAIAIARTHGQLTWFLAQAGAALAPVLQWSALPADQKWSFGTVVPTPDDLADAEQAVRRLHFVLAHIGAAEPPQATGETRAPAPHS
ncbi:hypothetical protein ACFVTF_28665 [Kitasatospora sp. NPDC057940]|uniref:hypothetical protein n=1 Tax=Kitasatospora sp. NPDC057940 TaxID=3346285 RepID=UPI0036DED33A